MTLQIVFIDCEPLENFRQFALRMHHIETGKVKEQIYSPRWKHMLDQNALKFKNCNVLYIHYYQDEPRYANIYEFIFQCRPSSDNKNLFLLEKRQFLEVTPFDTLFTKGNIYIPISGDKLPCSNSVEMKRYLVAYLLQACHLLSLWKKCGLLESEKKLIRLSSTTMEIEQSKGNHVHIREEAWIFNTSTFIIGLLIDYYQIEGELPNAQLNFSNDAEYRFKVAIYLFNVLKAFCINNGKSINTSSADEVISNTIEIAKSL